MKKIYLYTLLLGLLAIVSCKDDDSPVIELVSPAALQSLTGSEYILTKENASQDFPAIKWTPADYGMSAVVKYQVMLTNKDATDKKVMIGETQESELKLTNAQMNEFMGKIGAYPGQQYNFNISLVSIAYDDKFVNDASNSIDFKATLYNPNEVEWEYMYVAEGYPDWDWTTAYMLGDPDGDGVYRGYVHFKGNTNYTVLDAKTLEPVGEQNKEVSAGFYEIVWDGTGVTQSGAPLVWGIIGDATPGGWDTDTQFEFDEDSRLLTKVVRLLNGKEFKFRANNDWGINFGAVDGHESDMEGELVANGTNFKVSAPTDTTFIISLNLVNAGKYTFTTEMTDVELSSAALYLPGSYQGEGGWKPEADDCYTVTSPSRDFIYTGIHYFPANTEFKFTDGPTWGNEFAITKGAKIEWNEDKTEGQFNLVTSDGSNILVEYASYYSVEVNVKKLTCKFIKSGWEIIGDATPGGWDKGTIMEYDPDTKLWTVTLDMIGGKEYKFRWNKSWDINLGGTLDALTQGGDNIPSTAGNFTFVLDPEAGKATMTKN